MIFGNIIICSKKVFKLSERKIEKSVDFFFIKAYNGFSTRCAEGLSHIKGVERIFCL